MNKFQDLKKQIEAMQEDAERFYQKGNSAAGVRLRKGMQELKAAAQEIREDVQRIKNQNSQTA
ncbi:MAG TPA: histone H1 [Chryseosolibacter sp.]